MQLNHFSLRIPEGNELPSGHVELPHKQEYSILIHNYRDVDCIAQVYVDGKDVGRFHIKAKSNLRVEHPENCNRRFLFLKADTDAARDADGDSVQGNDRGLVQVTFLPVKRGIEKSEIGKLIEALKQHTHHHHHYYDYWYWWPHRSPKVWYYGESWSIPAVTCSTSGSSGVSVICSTQDCHDAGSGHIGTWERTPQGGIQDNAGQHSPGITGLGSISDQDLPMSLGDEKLLDEEPTTLSVRLVAVPEQRKTVAPLRPIVRRNPIPTPVGT